MLVLQLKEMPLYWSGKWKAKRKATNDNKWEHSMDEIRKCMEPLADILHDLGTDIEDDLESLYNDDLLRDMGIDMSNSPDEYGDDEIEGREW